TASTQSGRRWTGSTRRVSSCPRRWAATPTTRWCLSTSAHPAIGTSSSAPTACASTKGITPQRKSPPTATGATSGSASRLRRCGSSPMDTDVYPKSADQIQSWDFEADVVIAGYGIAGVAAAVEAATVGADVLVLERTGGWGGAAAMAGGFIYLGG